jgi:hypothetical protein
MPYRTERWFYSLSDDDVELTPYSFPGATRVVLAQDPGDVIAFGRGYAYVEYRDPIDRQAAIWNVHQFVLVDVEPCHMTLERAIEWVGFQWRFPVQHWVIDRAGVWVRAEESRPVDKCTR